MGRRAETAAQGDHETLIARVEWLWANRREIPFDVEPGPAGQWYFADWLADPKVRRMSWSARGVHMDTICSAWGDHPPTSCPAGGEDLADLFADVSEADRRRVLRAWVEHNGRIWQPGLCKTYLSQIQRRLGPIRGGLVKARGTKDLPDLDMVETVLTTCPPYGDQVVTRWSPPPLPLQSPSSSLSPEKKHPSDALVGDADASRDDTPKLKRAAAKNGNVAEMRWRIEECWQAHLATRAKFWAAVEFRDQPPGPPPALSQPRRKLIAEALKRCDGDLLGAEKREEWAKWSKARAAGIGIFLDKWLTGQDEQNKVGEGGKRFLEPERAWQFLNKKDQCERHAEAYFEYRQRKETR